MEPTYIFNWLLEVAPVAAVLGVVIFFLYRDSREAAAYARANDRENIKTLSEITHVLESLVAGVQENKIQVVDAVRKEAVNVKEHVDKRIDILEARTGRSN